MEVGPDHGRASALDIVRVICQLIRRTVTHTHTETHTYLYIYMPCLESLALLDIVKTNGARITNVRIPIN